jgi:predicted DNA-binding transcriptional regulator AlpA
MPDFPVSNSSSEFNSLTATAPVLTREAFAQQVGLTAPTVYSMCDRGYLPTVHFGRRVFINVEVLRRQCAEKAF